MRSRCGCHAGLTQCPAVRTTGRLEASTVLNPTEKPPPAVGRLVAADHPLGEPWGLVGRRSSIRTLAPKLEASFSRGRRASLAPR